MIDVSLPLHTESTNAKLRVHWRTLRAKAKRERGVVALVLRSAGLRELAPAERAVVTLVRTQVPRSRGLDDDNLRGALKAVRDEVAKALGVDDKEPRVTWRYAETRGSEHGVRIVIEGDRLGDLL